MNCHLLDIILLILVLGLCTCFIITVLRYDYCINNYN